MFLDLHNHTTYSDGINSVTKFLDLAKENKVKAISITEHDSIEGVKEFVNKNYKFNVFFCSGL